MGKTKKGKKGGKKSIAAALVLAGMISTACGLWTSASTANARSLDEALKNISFTAGIGGSIPVRNSDFVDATKGMGIYRVFSTEYEVSPRLRIGGTYGGDKIDLNPTPLYTTDGKRMSGTTGGGTFNSTTWGPYALMYFDIIPDNGFMGYLTFGANKTTIDGTEAAPQWDVFSGGGVEFYPVNANVKFRLGVTFGDMADNSIGSLRPYVALNLSPLALSK